MNNNADFNRIIHIHGHNDFDLNDESTSHIENVRADLKGLLSRAYVEVKADNFIYFLKDWEYRKKIVYLKDSEKIADIQFILNHISTTAGYNLFIKEELEDFNKLIYDEESSSDEDDE